ncbi:hypothetical protein BC6307_12995 [Sutcliffiella cohnii]|uniref:Uncharacterized protein n=1 Tax=Sutcliffiella cohnii TaxID=33932 RepID=A0A223KS41_9BACI|nr:hypothetical protein BC6307_12995 [Sutcliffiella cohnii]
MQAKFAPWCMKIGTCILNCYIVFSSQGQEPRVERSGRCETPAGVEGRLRPHRALARGRLSSLPAESEHLKRSETDKFNTALLFSW